MDSTTVVLEPDLIRTNTDSEREWFALRVKPQHERTVSYALHKRGFECYVPLHKALRRWSESLKELDLPIFPGYVFCRMDPAQSPGILATPAVYNLVGRGAVPAPVEDHELHMIQRIEQAGLPVIPWPYLKEGQRVGIARGPLAGVSGLLAISNKSWHVVVNVQLLQRGVAVTVDRSDLAPLAQVATA